MTHLRYFTLIDDNGTKLELTTLGNIPTELYDSTGKNLDLTDNSYVPVDTQDNGHVCTDNSTQTPLGIGGVFPGVWQDTLNYNCLIVGVKSDEDSATNGMLIEWSADGVTVHDSDQFSILADAGKVFTFSPARRYVKITYTNGGVAQTTFDIQTIFKKGGFKPSSHRINDSIVAEDDAELVKAVLTGENPGGTFVNFQSTTAGNFKTSLEELESGVSSNSNSQLNVTPFESGGGEYSQDLKTGAFTTIDHAHHEIHSGDHFFTGNYTTLANGATYDILFVTPNTLEYAHMIFEISTEAEAMFNYYEGTTTSSDGTPLVMFDRNRTTDNTPSVTFYHTPTVTTTGTEIGAGIFGSGKTQGGGLRDSNEFMLKPNTKYLLRVTNNTVSNNWYDWQFDWYEHTDR